jgi:hypothetical protein
MVMDFVLIMKLVQCIHNFFNGNLKVYNSLSQNIKEDFLFFLKCYSTLQTSKIVIVYEVSLDI